jgi:hypothetical protein
MQWGLGLGLVFLLGITNLSCAGTFDHLSMRENEQESFSRKVFAI